MFFSPPQSPPLLSPPPPSLPFCLVQGGCRSLQDLCVLRSHPLSFFPSRAPPPSPQTPYRHCLVGGGAAQHGGERGARGRAGGAGRGAAAAATMYVGRFFRFSHPLDPQEEAACGARGSLFIQAQKKVERGSAERRPRCLGSFFLLPAAPLSTPPLPFSLSLPPHHPFFP